MENKYNNGKIFKIVSRKTNDVYIGSTIKDLDKTINKYRLSYKNYLEHKLKYMSLYNVVCYEDADIYLIENYQCENNDELERRRRYIQTTTSCCDKITPTKSRKDYYKDCRNEYDQEYHKIKIECNICKKMIFKFRRNRHQKSKKCLACVIPDNIMIQNVFKQLVI